MTLQEALDELQSLDTNNVGAWPTFAYAGACILLLVVLVAGGYYQFATPKLEQLDRITREEDNLKKEFEKKQKKVAALDAYREQLAEMERSFGSMLRQLPSKTEVANLLTDISQTRVASGLEEKLFKPDAEQPKEFYAIQPNRIHVVGTYHDIAGFVSRVSSLPRIVTINEVQLKQQKDSENDELTMEATVNTYRYLDEDEEAAQ